MVFVSMLDLERGSEAIEALNGAASRLQGAVGREVRMKYTPHLEFHLDAAVVRGERIDAILRDMKDDSDEEE